MAMSWAGGWSAGLYIWWLAERSLKLCCPGQHTTHSQHRFSYKTHTLILLSLLCIGRSLLGSHPSPLNPTQPHFRFASLIGPLVLGSTSSSALAALDLKQGGAAQGGITREQLQALLHDMDSSVRALPATAQVCVLLGREGGGAGGGGPAYLGGGDAGMAGRRWTMIVDSQSRRLCEK